MKSLLRMKEVFLSYYLFTVLCFVSKTVIFKNLLKFYRQILALVLRISILSFYPSFRKVRTDNWLSILVFFPKNKFSAHFCLFLKNTHWAIWCLTKLKTARISKLTLISLWFCWEAKILSNTVYNMISMIKNKTT